MSQQNSQLLKSLNSKYSPVISVNLTEREQLYQLIPMLNERSKIIFRYIYCDNPSNKSMNEIIDSIPEEEIHRALTRVRNQIIDDLETT